MPSEVFEAQAALLVCALPYAAVETCFALNGGTAINLFIRDLPRLRRQQHGFWNKPQPRSRYHEILITTMRRLTAEKQDDLQHIRASVMEKIFPPLMDHLFRHEYTDFLKV